MLTQTDAGYFASALAEVGGEDYDTTFGQLEAYAEAEKDLIK